MTVYKKLFRLARIPPPAPPPITPEQDIGTAWLIAGDSQTEGRATPSDTPCRNPGQAFRLIWNENENSGADITTFTNVGTGGSSLADTHSRYLLRTDRGTRTWVHFQESGDRMGDGGSQDTVAEFIAEFKDFVRDIRSNSPNAIISTETPNNFDRTAAQGSSYGDDRNWTSYEQPMRDAIDELYNEEDIRVYLAEVNAVIEAIEVYSNGGITITKADVWYQESEGGLAAHYTPFGNFMVALAMLCALGYDPTGYTFTSITDVTANQKTAAVAVIADFIPGA